MNYINVGVHSLNHLVCGQHKRVLGHAKNLSQRDGDRQICSSVMEGHSPHHAGVLAKA